MMGVTNDSFRETQDASASEATHAEQEGDSPVDANEPDGSRFMEWLMWGLLSAGVAGLVLLRWLNG
jgi:hypothetical protein